MDIRSIANAATQTINPNITVSLQRSTGYTMGAGRRQVPSYAPPVVGPAQIQALDSSDLKQMDGVNIQGEIKAAYLRGVLAGVVKADQVGGDLITIASGVFAGEWLVTKVLEGWPTWTKVAITRQVL